MKCDKCGETYGYREDHECNKTPGGMEYSGLPKVTDTPPMPECRPPRPEEYCQCNPLPRKEVISIQPGDTIVLDCHGPITAEFHKLAKADIKKAFPGHKSVILHDGLTLEVYREQGKDEPEVDQFALTQDGLDDMGEQVEDD